MKLWSAPLSSLALIATLGACAQTLPSAPPPITQSQPLEQPRLFDDENVLVLLSSSQEANELAVNVSRRGYQLNERQSLDGFGLILLDFQRPPGVSDEVALNDMQAMSPSAIVGLDGLYKAQAPYEMPSQSSAYLYANELIDWPMEGCRAQTSIGIIDGHLADAPMLDRDAEVIRRSFTRGDAAASDHANMVAKLIAGPGRLNGAKIYSAGVIGKTKSGYQASGAREILLALDWMRRSDVQLVNISLAGPHNPLLERVFSLADESGMVIVAAVGNEGPDAPPQFPAAYEPVIAVTAVDADQKIFQNAVRGTHVEYAAPGVDIFVGSETRSGRFVTGTSFAAPFVTSLIAADPAHSFAGRSIQVRSFLNQHLRDLGEAGPDPVFGHGLIRLPSVCVS